MVAVVVARAAVAAVAVAAMVAAARRCKTRSLRTARLCNGCACIRSCTTWRTPAAGLAVAAEMADSEAAVAVVAKAPASPVAVAVDLEGSYARGEPRTIGRSRPSSRCPQGCDDDAPVRLQCSIWPRARACCRRYSFPKLENAVVHPPAQVESWPDNDAAEDDDMAGSSEEEETKTRGISRR